MEAIQATDRRLIIVSAPKGSDPGEALFSEGVEVGDQDILLFIEKSGNVEIQVLEGDAEALLNKSLVDRRTRLDSLDALVSGARMVS
jgi:hypothetical protein